MDRITLTDHFALSAPEKETVSAPPRLAHTVYFSLKDPTEAMCQRLIDACHKYLSDHPG